MARKPKPNVRIRMYRQGLGDCFLLTFPGENGDLHMLIDCGVLLGTKNAKGIMTKVMENVEAETGGHLHLVVATHEHWDHISGFLQAQEVFDRIKIDEVWVAWTEDPANELAKELRRAKAKSQEGLKLALDQMNSPTLTGLKAGIEKLFDFVGDLGVKGGTKDAWDYLRKRGEESKIEYCYPGRKPLNLSAVEGVRIYVLGPPEDRKMINKLNPTKTGKEVYEFAHNFSFGESFLAVVRQQCGLDNANEADLYFPFDSQYRITSDKAQTDSFFMKYYASPDKEWRKIDVDWMTVAGELALNLDNATNNTCLALAIELVNSGKVLLFPGDAQVGNWLSWEQYSWKVKDKDGESATITAQDLLERTALYKVGHHGSHNATLRDKGLELMKSSDLVALIPVNSEMAKKKEWAMPFRPLLERLNVKARGRILQADIGDFTEIEKPAAVTNAEWERFQKATQITEDFIDFTIPI